MRRKTYMLNKNKGLMKKVILALIGILVLSACSRKSDIYKKEIDGIFISHWESYPIPQRGIVFMYRKGTHFSELMDSVRFVAIKRGRVDSTYLACLLHTKKLNHLSDIRVVLDDSLVFDVSNIEIMLIKDKKRWGMWGPIEWDMIPSLLVNGHVTRDTTLAGELAFPRECVRIIKKR